MVVYICVFNGTNDIAGAFENLGDARRFVRSHKASKRLSIVWQEVK
jgi:hypothetical protein